MYPHFSIVTKACCWNTKNILAHFKSAFLQKRHEINGAFQSTHPSQHFLSPSSKPQNKTKWVQTRPRSISLRVGTSGSSGMKISVTVSSQTLMYTGTALSQCYHQISLFSEALITHRYHVISAREFCSSPPVFLLPWSFSWRAPAYSFSCPHSECFRSRGAAHHSISISFFEPYIILTTQQFPAIRHIILVAH